MNRVKRSYLTAVMFFLCASFAQAQVIVQGTITTNTTWTNDNTYLLRGGVFVGNDITETILTIEPGTLILGESESGGFLCVRRHSKIMAIGTPSEPIVFTSDKLEGEKARGDWGGVILNGLSHVNLEGGYGQGEGNTGTYGGGLNPILDDNSGVIKYVRIEYAGYPITPEDELNGLALQGVGSGTEIDYVQIHMGGDDGIEMFGGSVNFKHVFLTGNLDDQFDWTFGWTGKAQFVICQQYDDSGDRGIESDNSEFNHSAEPRSFPHICNMTLFGNSNPVNNPDGITHHRGTGCVTHNSIIMNFEDAAYDIDDEETFNNAWNFVNDTLNGNLVFDHGIIVPPGQPFANGEIAETDDETGMPFTSLEFITVLNQNNQFVDAMLTDPSNVDNPDFRPQPGSPALSGWIDPTTIDPWFDYADYIGGMDPNNNWLAGWTLGGGGTGYVSWPMDLNAGWNLISLPVEVANNNLSALFPTATVAYEFNPASGYVYATQIENGKGYWVNVPAGETSLLVGTPFVGYTTPVTPPWELLGGVFNPYQVPTLDQGQINAVYYFDPSLGYVSSPNFEMNPGKGYWVNMTSEATMLTLSSADHLNKKTNPSGTDEDWSLLLTATGDDAIGAPYIFTSTIAGGSAQNYIPAPPAPPSYATYIQLYDEGWNGPYNLMQIVWPSLDTFMWRIEVDPNGNVMPPVVRTTTVSWDANDLPSEGEFFIVDAVYGDTIVVDMRAQTSFDVEGSQLKYYNIFTVPPPPVIPDVQITLTPYGTPIVIPEMGGSFDYNIALTNTTSSAQTTDIWCQIALPGVGTVTPLSVLDITLPAGITGDRDRSQSVPANAPAGTYTIYGFVGEYPWVVEDYDCFTFEKAGTDFGGSLGFAELWSNTGESFNFLQSVEAVPEVYALCAAYPNPFNPVTTLSFALSKPEFVKLSVFDISGRQVATLVNGWRDSGNHQVTFDATGLASGVYVYRIEAGEFAASAKMVLMK